MGYLSSMFNGLANSLSIKRRRKVGSRKCVDGLTKKNELIDESKNVASVYSKRGEKGVNQDRCIVWKDFGCERDMLFCGIFDGHGPWGHFVAKEVSVSMPSSLLCYWQETLAEFGEESEEKLHRFNIWKHSYLKTYAAIDRKLEHHPKIDAFHSGTAALTIVRQGDDIFVANAGDCRAVLATCSDNGDLVAEQLTTDFKPNLPKEANRISECNGRVYCLRDEPGVHRLWLPHEESPGLAMSRAFGDYCIKDFGLISVPQVTQRRITSKDQFVVLATDGVWDAISNQEAVRIVSASRDRAKSAKRLVESAANEWRRRRKGIAMDDISAILLFLHSSALWDQPDFVPSSK